MEEIITQGNARNYAAVLRAASIAERIWGYGHVKECIFKAVDSKWNDAVAQLSSRAVFELKQVA
ncbi:hypothetical protein CupriaWKF_03095 [Cupriavidus sp. WKF15]|uniref:hypothetical protein n=1 Tax=Cupriavidus sp. WKF15 TaxID=3032282 RepID=UPI0023E19F37|nr:hypothetical protein [Cupriavidus sp. WKF15]WER46589.1 hypothetical protein CupriaWKF_03095 [Cupriavidus sp. WKF15]